MAFRSWDSLVAGPEFFPVFFQQILALAMSRKNYFWRSTLCVVPSRAPIGARWGANNGSARNFRTRMSSHLQTAVGRWPLAKQAIDDAKRSQCREWTHSHFAVSEHLRCPLHLYRQHMCMLWLWTWCCDCGRWRVKPLNDGQKKPGAMWRPCFKQDLLYKKRVNFQCCDAKFSPFVFTVKIAIVFRPFP